MAKGRKPEYFEGALSQQANIKLTPDQYEMMTLAGTIPDYWRPAIVQLARFKVQLDLGQIDVDQYQKLISEAMVAMLPGEGGEDAKT